MHFKVFNVLLEKRKKTKLFIIILLNIQLERNTQNNKFSFEADIFNSFPICYEVFIKNSKNPFEFQGC